MTKRYICIHGHFYQPPRENPGLETVELQDSAYPFHDWNERITAECYAPNTVARILDNDHRIAKIVNNYARMNFNFGPTLLSWIEEHSPDVYQAIVAADKESIERFSGHGSAIAQVYNHIIMPLANHRDRVTQVVWGIRDFEHRFGRHPEGMWLAEAAVDLETLDILAEYGIRYTILSPYQAGRQRPIESDGPWQDVSGGRVDPTQPYMQRLPSGKTIAIFFYDGPIARAVAFEGLLNSGELFANRLVSGFDESREHPQLVHIATDGESYGHHHADGEMALAYAMDYIEQQNLAKITNYGEFLDIHPPTNEVEIVERTAWSCSHGVGRWYEDCGCHSGGYPSWNQAWRGPLRVAFDWLRDKLVPLYEERATSLLYEPWHVRDDYIHVLLDRTPERVSAWLGRHAIRPLNAEEEVEILQLLEIQRHLMLMYTSCGWFFDELSGIETVQVIQFAGRAVQLATDLFGEEIEEEFLEQLAAAKSNLPEHRDGRHIYEKWVKPSFVDLVRVSVHYAISSLFDKRHAPTSLSCYVVESQDERRFDTGMAKILLGHAQVTSIITHERVHVVFGVLYFGDQNLNAGRALLDEDVDYDALAAGIAHGTETGDIAEVVRLLDTFFEGLDYSLQSLFHDARRTFLNLMLESTHANDEAIYRQLYERRANLMNLLSSLSTPLPRTLHAAAEFVINSDLRRAAGEGSPDREEVQALLERAHMWDIQLNTSELAYTLEQTMGRVASQVSRHASELDALHSLEALVDVAHMMPFGVDFWKIQNTYYRLMTSLYIEMQECADDGDEDAQAWVTQFITLGDKLGVRVTEMQDFSTTPTVASITKDVLSQQRIPRATYRLQFNPSFGFADVEQLVPYLDELGVSDCYVSPIFLPREGSSHGYDVCDHSTINPVLGGEEGFISLSRALRERGMSIVLDTVPNHMGIGDENNQWWMDVLENGPGSFYAPYFDIEWQPVKPELKNKVLLPILGDQYGKILENGELTLVYEAGSFTIRYYEHVLPVAPGTYGVILGTRLDPLTERLDTEDEHLQEFQSILTAISYLPPRTERDPQKLIERNREKEVIKRRIDALYQESEAVHEEIDQAILAFNGNVDDPNSFDLLDDLIHQQSYRPAFWRVAAEEINYRRFFDINDLAAIRTEDPAVFHDTHALIFRLLTEGHIQGLRIDHIDGLYDPSSYFAQLQHDYVFHQVKARLARVRPQMPDDETLATRVSNRIAAYLATEDETSVSTITTRPLYVVAEKILAEDEPLPQHWLVHGTTGYDFLSTVNNLFVHSEHGSRFDAIYHDFINEYVRFDRLVNEKKKVIMLGSMDSEIYALSHQLERIAERNRRYRDFTLNTLTAALREVIAALPVYRTYTDGSGEVLPRDRQYIEHALSEARHLNPRTAKAVFDFIQETLLLSNVADFRPDDRTHLIGWVRKFQQLSGPVMAKGVEDTAFYVYNRLVSLNEVGGHPQHFGSTVAGFHERNTDNQRAWPHTMLASSTHDTKRSADVRARINVLSELPTEWQAAVERWADITSDRKTYLNGDPSPDPNDEYLLYQTLVGAWPLACCSPEGIAQAVEDGSWATFRERIGGYMHKATKEAKVRTSWVNANQGYDDAVQSFVAAVLPDDPADPFVADMAVFARRISVFGQINSLAQTLLKLTSPGVPDIYQGTELWDLSLVDPDNRRPVDYGHRRALLSSLTQAIEASGSDRTALAQELLASANDGRIKLYLISELLTLRRAMPDLFARGSYLPLEGTGPQAAHVCAFLREWGETMVIVVVPRLVVGLTKAKERPPIGTEVWGETWLSLPAAAADARFRNRLTGELLSPKAHKNAHALPMAAICASFPVALLERVND